MTCSCIKGYYNFDLYYLDCKKFVYKDLSDWTEGDKPEAYEVLVSYPGAYEKTLLTLKTTEANEITSVDLDITSGKTYIPDGIYCFEVKNCGTTYKRNRAVTCQLECKIDHLVAVAETEMEFDAIRKYKFYVESIHFNTSFGKIEKAQFFYDRLKKELNCVNCNCG